MSSNGEIGHKMAYWCLTVQARHKGQYRLSWKGKLELGLPTKFGEYKVIKAETLKKSILEEGCYNESHTNVANLEIEGLEFSSK